MIEMTQNEGLGPALGTHRHSPSSKYSLEGYCDNCWAQDWQRFLTLSLCGSDAESPDATTPALLFNGHVTMSGILSYSQGICRS